MCIIIFSCVVTADIGLARRALHRPIPFPQRRRRHQQQTNDAYIKILFYEMIKYFYLYIIIILHVHGNYYIGTGVTAAVECGPISRLYR